MRFKLNFQKGNSLLFILFAILCIGNLQAQCPNGFKAAVGDGISLSPADMGAENMLLEDNSIKVTRNDVTLGNFGLTPSGQENYAEYFGAFNAQNVAAPAFVTTTNFVQATSGGWANILVYGGGVTDVTYTFCKPVTDPYVFFGYWGINVGSSVEFIGKTVTLVDKEAGLTFSGGNKLTAPVLSNQHGYVKVNGTMTSFTIRFTAPFQQRFTVMVGKCKDAPAPPVGTPATCAGPTSTWKYVNFTLSGFTNAEYSNTGVYAPKELKDFLNTSITNASGSGVTAQLTIADPDPAIDCSTFGSVPNGSGPWNFAGSGVANGSFALHYLPSGGKGVKAVYKFNKPIKLRMNSYYNFGLAHGEFITFEAKKAGAPVVTTASWMPGSQQTTPGVITTKNGGNLTLITGSLGGNWWTASPVDEIDEITITFAGHNNNATAGQWYKEEAYSMEICSAPCQITYPACAAANQRTEAFGFTRTSATAATGAKGANNVTVATSATVPVLAAATTGANALNECGDPNTQMNVSSGGWVLLGAKANSSGSITYNFSQPVTDPMILVWNIYSTTKIDVGGVTTCLKPVRTWYGATVGSGIANPADQTSITGTGLFWGVGYYQIPGTYTSLTFTTQTGVFENWFYMSIGEGSCNTTPQPVSPTASILACSAPGTDVRTYDANFTTTVVPYVSASGTTYTAATGAYDNTINVNVNQNVSGYFGLYSYTAGAAGQAPSGCAPDAPLASAGGGAVYAYAGIGLWNNGNMRITFQNAVTNPIIKIKHLSWTRLTFKDCTGALIPTALVNAKNGFALTGSSVRDSNDWSDGAEGEGAVQLIGRFKTIDIAAEKTSGWGDYFTLTVSEQVCVNPATIVKTCTPIVPTCPAGGGAPTAVAAGFAKNGIGTALGSLSIAGNSAVAGISSTSAVLTASTNRAPSTFADATCYAVKAVGGGSATLSDIGGNGVTTITFNQAVTNPLIYLKDVTRIQLNFANTVDADGVPACCLKQISGSNGLTTTGMTVADNNPTENGSPSVPTTPGCGIVQLIGTFKTITINTSRPSGDTRVNDWTISVAGEAVCLPTNILASLGTPANPIVLPSNPIALRMDKKVANIKPKDPANPMGNQIVTFHIEVQNQTTTKINDLFVEDKLDEKFPAGTVVAVTSTPKVIWADFAMQVGNPNFNGKTNLDLLLPSNNMLAPNALIRIAYAIEIDPTKIAAGSRHDNTVNVGSTSMAVSGSARASMYLPSAVQLPMNKERGICDGNGGVEFAKFLQCLGGLKVTPNAQCGKIKWGWDWTHDYTKPHCGNAETKNVVFKGVDECGNNYVHEATYTTNDDCPPQLDMMPMDKTVSCGDPNAVNTINMWLGMSGGAWFHDPGQEPKTITTTHDYTQTTCVPGTYVVTFKFTDICGKSTTAKATLTVLNPTGTKEVLVMANKVENKSTQCSANQVTFDEPEMKTTCSDGIVHSSFTDIETKGLCDNEYEKVRIWNFSDNCSNSYIVKQVITVTDDTAPTFDANKFPTQFTMNKGFFPIWKKLYLNKVFATDNCSAVTQTAPTFKVIAPNAVECTINASDACGNMGYYTVVVTFENNSKIATGNKVSASTNTAEEIITNLASFVNQEVTETIETEAVVFPNPTSQMVNVIPAQGIGDIQKIRIYNINGKVMLNMDVEGQQDKVISIDISNFYNATYIIEMEHTTKKVYKQVIKS